MAEAALGFGSNQGDRAENIRAALARLEERGAGRILQASPFYCTPPWGDTNQEDFLNACALLETSLSPQDLLGLCLEIERELGRDRAKERRWGPRSIDIDILFYDDAELDTPDLSLPHPHMLDRAFVLIPLADVAPEKIIRGRRVSEAAVQIDRSGVVIWEAEGAR